jgi:hypothetical protein
MLQNQKNSFEQEDRKEQVRIITALTKIANTHSLFIAYFEFFDISEETSEILTDITTKDLEVFQNKSKWILKQLKRQSQTKYKT